MNRPPHVIFHEAAIVQQGPLPAMNEEYTLFLQSLPQAETAAQLEETIFNQLSPEQRTFLIKRDKSYFEKHFKNGHIGLGIAVQGQLVAQSLIVLPTAAAPQTGLVDSACLPAEKEKIAVFSGSMVHPDFRGNGLQAILTKVRKAAAMVLGREHLLTEIDINNTASWRTLMKEGFKISAIEKDTRDGGTSYILHDTLERLQNPFNLKAQRTVVLCPANDLAQQKELLAQGYQGHTYHKKKDALVFAKRKTA